MNTTTQNQLVAAALILFAICARLLPGTLIPNFAPVTAVAVFSAFAFSGSRLQYFVPFITMIVSDVLLAVLTGNAMYLDPTQVVVYASILLIVALSAFVFKRSSSALTRAGVTLSGSVFFFIVTNFAVWAMGTMYPMTYSGFVQCYTMALPFYRNALVADVFYAAVLFGAYEVALRLSGQRASVKS